MLRQLRFIGKTQPAVTCGERANKRTTAQARQIGTFIICYEKSGMPDAPHMAQKTDVAAPGKRATLAAGGLPVAAIGIAYWRSNSMCVTPSVG